MLDFLIIGQGLAGSLLANQLSKKSYSFHIISDPKRPSSSAAAGGMFNPVTGKHLAKTWLADELFPFLHQYYTQLESDLGNTFFHPTPIYRPFKNENQKKQFELAIKKHDVGHYCTVTEPTEYRSQFIKEDLGGIHTTMGGWVDVPKMTALLRQNFESQGCLTESIFDFKQIEFCNGHVKYGKLEAKKLIFCEGFYVKDNPYFNMLPFNPVKGETIKAEIPQYKLKEIINQNSWVLPLTKNQYRLGATYSWHELDFEPTEKGRNVLKERIGNYLKHPYDIIDQIAGVRPATKDRRPIIGPHPKFQNLLILNGLGTKGVSLAPYLISQFIDYLEGTKELHPEITIERFYTLY